MPPSLGYIFQYVQPLRRKLTETVNNWNVPKYEGHNSVTNCLIVPKTELNLDVLMINIYSKFHFSMYNLCEECERKLLVNWLTDRPTDRSKATYPPFFEVGGGINIRTYVPHSFLRQPKFKMKVLVFPSFDPPY